MARPTKLTKTVVKKLEEAFVLGASIEEACFYADITKQTYYNWKDENEELFDRFMALRLSPVLKARKALVEGLENNPNLALRYLERKRRDEFSKYAKKTEEEGMEVTLILGKNGTTKSS